MLEYAEISGEYADTCEKCPFMNIYAANIDQAWVCTELVFKNIFANICKYMQLYAKKM